MFEAMEYDALTSVVAEPEEQRPVVYLHKGPCQLTAAVGNLHRDCGSCKAATCTEGGRACQSRASRSTCST